MHLLSDVMYEHMSVTREQVQHLARLSALKLTDAEIEHFAHDMDSILAYVEQLNEIDVTGIEPLLHPIPGSVAPLHTDIEPYGDPDGLLVNVQHPITHRQITISTSTHSE